MCSHNWFGCVQFFTNPPIPTLIIWSVSLYSTQLTCTDKNSSIGRKQSTIVSMPETAVCVGAMSFPHKMYLFVHPLCILPWQNCG